MFTFKFTNRPSVLEIAWENSMLKEYHALSEVFDGTRIVTSKIIHLTHVIYPYRVYLMCCNHKVRRYTDSQLVWKMTMGTSTDLINSWCKERWYS